LGEIESVSLVISLFWKGNMKRGVCKLTGNFGEFVGSHLIPNALTKPGFPGQRFISSGEGSRPKRGWTSWYDEELVIRKGENILEAYDSWAIRELRRLKLVWSGWEDGETSLPGGTWFGPKPEGIGVRIVECANPDKLRLFFLSLLWRAVATTRPEFRVNIDPPELELLRTMVRDGNPRPLDFYPTSLLQIVSLGDRHNMGPIATEFGTYRFYFDGLIAHMQRRGEQIDFGKVGSSMVGFSTTLSVQTQTWEDSSQRTRMLQHMKETAAIWPGEVKKLLSSSSRRRDK
jgi:hypothetical protein